MHTLDEKIHFRREGFCPDNLLGIESWVLYGGRERKRRWIKLCGDITAAQSLWNKHRPKEIRTFIEKGLYYDIF